MNVQDVLAKHKLWLDGNEDGKCANLREADLREANLRWADLRGADLYGADLREADLRWANLSGANLSEADLSEADLSEADLRGADLSEADLRGADLRWANLSGAKGLLTARNFMAQFERDEYGWLVFKSFNEHYQPPDYWTIEAGAFIEEVVNQSPTSLCACGVNFATLEWTERECNKAVWRCRIRYEDAPDITVPYNTDGKARCGRLELLEPMEK